MRQWRRVTVATPGEWRCKTGGVRRLAVANGPNIFQMLLVCERRLTAGGCVELCAGVNVGSSTEHAERRRARLLVRLRLQQFLRLRRRLQPHIVSRLSVYSSCVRIHSCVVGPAERVPQLSRTWGPSPVWTGCIWSPPILLLPDMF